jgi:beta-N-acetylhexosaminidase
VTVARHGRRGLLAVALAGVALAGCGSNVKPAPHEPPGELALGLPVPDAVAQLFAVGFAGTDPKASIVARLRTRPWGVVVLDHDNAKAPGQTAALVKALKAAAHRGNHPAPLVADSEPEAFPGSRLSPQPEQGSSSVAKQQAQATARAMRAAGVWAVFAPVADIADAGGPAEDTGFSEDAETAARLTRGAASGWRSGGVQPVIGHFPGQGGASQDPEEGTATVGLSLADLRSRDLKPFAAATSRAGGFEISVALYNAFDSVTPAALLPDPYRMLRRTGFEGLAMSGDLVAATAATGGSVGAAAIDALRAGADLLYVPGDAGNQDEAYRAVLAAVQRGRITRERLADALLHVATLKRAAQSVAAPSG